MKLSLSKNIYKLRKENGMTQEQLAEALGVTFASVSKWERGIATPELNLIGKMADLFTVSFDTLVGYNVQNSGVIAIEERIHDLEREKNYDEAIIEAEKALLRYPNNFRIVYRCGELYTVAGIEQKNEKYLYRCIELLHHSILLLSQNNNPDISEILIQNQIAQCYIVLGKVEKGIDILKKYNVGGVHNSLIAITYTSQPKFDSKEVEPYMMSAFADIITSTTRTIMAYSNYYFKIKDYPLSHDSLIWLINILKSIKIDQNAVAYVDRIIAVCYSKCAHLSLILGEIKKVEMYLKQAYQIAKKFDNNPTYKISNIKFCVGNIEKVTAYDDLGESAIVSIEKQLKNENHSEQLLDIWNKLVEKEAGGDS